MDVARTIKLSGFDPQREPEIRVLTDGTLYVVFNFMPPSDFEGDDLGPYHDFDAQMSRAIGVPVTWEDREFFHIESPQADTIDRLVAFISTYRSIANPADRDKFGPGENPIEDELHRRFADVLVPAGYKLTKRDNDVEEFVRHGDGIRQRIVLWLWDRAPLVEFTVRIGIRVDAVEAIHHLFSRCLPEYQDSTDTCLIKLEAFVPHLDRLTVHDAASIQQAVDQLTPYITNQILPFLDSHLDVKSLDRLMNQGQPAGQAWGMEGWGQGLLWYAMSAIILAHFAQNPDFDKLVERYRDEIREEDEDELERYEKLVAHLRSLK